MLLLGCSSSSRFTSEENEHSDKSPVNSRNDENKDKELSDNDEYRNMPVLESEIGIASFYGNKFHGRKTASGEIYDQNSLTAAHLNYPFNTIIRVTNMLNNKSVVVRVNDRRPDFNGRICDLSKKAASMLEMIKKGISKVKLEVLKWGDK